MASKKNLKKDINFLTDEVIGTCLMHQALNKGKKDNELDEIINETLIFREELIEKVNNPKPTDANKNLRSYYRNLYSELLKKVNDTFDKLNEITE